MSANSGSHLLYLTLEDKMGFKPLHDRVLVRRLGEEDKTAGGIIIPDTAQETVSYTHLTLPTILLV